MVKDDMHETKSLDGKQNVTVAIIFSITRRHCKCNELIEMARSMLNHLLKIREQMDEN